MTKIMILKMTMVFVGLFVFRRVKNWLSLM